MTELKKPSSIGSAPSSPVSLLRLVMITKQFALPGSSGRTWASLRALSSTITSRRSDTVRRYSSTRSSGAAGWSWPGMPSSPRNRPSTSCGSRSRPAPRRSANSWPSGYDLRSRWAACTASADLPAPPNPDTTTVGVAVPVSLPSVSARTCFNASSRPVKSLMSGGRWCGTTWCVVATGAAATAVFGDATSSVPLRIAVCRSRSFSPGSIPSSSSRYSRASR